MAAKRMAVYAGMLEYMDMSIGRILAYLEEKKLLDNTVIVFMSDNGGESTELLDTFPEYYRKNFNLLYEHLGEKGTYSEYGPGWASVSMTPFSGFKIMTSEGGTRAPLIIRYPNKVPVGERIDAFAYVLDIVPTLLDLAGVDPKRSADLAPLGGRSVVPLLTGGAKGVYGSDDVVATELAGNIVVYRGDFKLVRNLPPYGDGQWHLYDIRADPTERNDIAKANPDLVKTMTGAYDDYTKKYGVVAVPADYSIVTQAKKNMQADH